MNRSFPVVLLAVAAFSTHALAESLPETHDGLLVGFGLGPSSSKMSSDGTLSNGVQSISAVFDCTGVGFDFEFRLGGAIMENLALHATLVGESISSPKTTGRIDNFAISGGGFKQVGVSLVGAGMTKYFMPANIFVSGSFGSAQFTYAKKSDSIVAVPDRGLGFELSTGKEWWVSPNWGLGVSANLLYASVNSTSQAGIITDKETDKWLSYGIRFSATFQ